MAVKRGRGERAGLTREKILDAALDLVDRVGLPALTMRSLGAELGVEAMTLYHYVPNKDALLDGMIERVYAGAAPDPDPAADWSATLRTYAHALRAALLRHPGMLSLAAIRPTVTPATLDAVERALAKLVDAGFPLGRAVHSVNALTLFVIGHTASEAAMAERDATAAPDAASEADPGSAPWVAGLDQERYPLLTRAAAQDEGVDDAERFAFAVEALLAGLGALGPRPG